MCKLSLLRYSAADILKVPTLRFLLEDVSSRAIFVYPTKVRSTHTSTLYILISCPVGARTRSEGGASAVTRQLRGSGTYTGAVESHVRRFIALIRQG